MENENYRVNAKIKYNFMILFIKCFFQNEGDDHRYRHGKKHTDHSHNQSSDDHADEDKYGIHS